MKSQTAHPSAGSLEVFERQHVHPTPGRTLIVGSRVYPGRADRRRLHEDAVGVDMLAGDGVDRVLNLEDDLPEDLGQFDHVECLSVLEHSRRPWLLAANLERLMAPGASLFVAVPFVWRVHAYPDDYWRMTPSAIRALFPRIEWRALKLAGRSVTDKPESTKIAGHPYFARTETVGFGVLA